MRLLPRRFQFWAPLVATLALTSSFALAWQNRELRAGIRLERQKSVLPHRGLLVPTFSARTLLGDMVTVGRSDEKLTQVLVVFNTTCQFCMQTLPLWQSVYDSLESQGVSFLGLSHDPDSLTRAYALTHELRFPVVTFPELKLISLYRASRVPLTMVLDDRGVVLYEHVGVLTNSSLDSLHAVVRASPAEDNEDLYRAGGTR